MIQHLTQLCEELSLPPPPVNKEKTYPLRINAEVLLQLKEFETGFSLFSTLTPCPEQKREELFTYLMNANFLGQGTGGASIGLNAEENILTLSRDFLYETNYQEFKDSIEDFVNYLLYWRTKIQEFS